MCSDRSSGEPTSLLRNEQGAIMMIGLFAAFSLAAALFFLIGIGDAIVYHDRGQAAADAAALSSAAIHARAMNATAAMNFVMLVMTGAYLSFAVIADLALVSAAYIISVPFAEKSGIALGEKAHTAFGRLIRFEQAMGTTLEVLDRTQTGLATSAPALGIPASREVATPLKYTAMSLGWSNFPYATIARPGERAPFAARPSAPNPPLQTPKSCSKAGLVCDMANKFFPVLKSPPAWNAGPNNGRSLGLPIAAEPATSLCIRAGGLFFKDFGDAVEPYNLGNGADEAMKIMKSRDKKLPIPVHCSDRVNRTVVAPMSGAARARDVWTSKGPKRMTASNGEMAMRVLAWATTREDSVTDKSLEKVKVGSYDFTGNNERSILAYDAQAEFFYDCAAKWGDAPCNGDEIGTSGVGNEHTLYWMNWRARLVRSRSPAQIFGGALNAVIGGGGRVVRAAGASAGEWERASNRFREQGLAGVSAIH